MKQGSSEKFPLENEWAYTTKSALVQSPCGSLPLAASNNAIHDALMFFYMQKFKQKLRCSVRPPLEAVRGDGATKVNAMTEEST